MGIGNESSRMLVLATRNQKKRRELAALLEPLGYALRTLDDYPSAIEVEESGQTFAENAALKAIGQAAATGEWCLGEDSGIVVDALEGAPGVYSARFAGEHATDEDNNQLLIARLAGVPRSRRSAHYVCHITLASPAGEILCRVEDICRGIVREAPAGNGGFGYDPLFEIAEYHRTFGELGASVKGAISHRARASRRLAILLRRSTTNVV